MKSRYERKKQKKGNNRRNLVTAIVAFSILLLASVAYGAFQFESGRSESSNKISTAKDIDSSPSLMNKTDFQSDTDVNEYINVMLVGVDTDEGEKARTDTIMIAQYHPSQGSVKIASIMRDSYVSIPGYKENKINASFFLGGPELLRKTIKENFDIDLHYFAMVNFDGFVEIVDVIAPKGVDVDIPQRMYYHSGPTKIDFQPGMQTLDGSKILDYVRFRSDNENDFGRVRRQQEILALLKDELMTINGLTRLPRLVGSIEPYVETNLSTTKVLSLGKDFFLHPVKNVETLTLPVPGGYSDKRYSHAGAVLELDMEKNKEALHEFFKVETPSSFAKKEVNEEKES